MVITLMINMKENKNNKEVKVLNNFCAQSEFCEEDVCRCDEKEPTKEEMDGALLLALAAVGALGDLSKEE